jgi:uncharacterized protein (TIGR02145 family)
MKKILFLSFCCVIFNFFSQPIKLAILDFENISGIAKYDGLGKAMSSMLISDIEANVSPKRIQLVERAQIQKVLKEQKFQTSGNVNKNTAVQAGKILGVNYLLVGDIYILNDQLIINARLTNTETGRIVFSKKQEGKTTAWLTLKTNIAKDLAINLSQPFTEPTIPDIEVPVATITTFGNAITAKDTGNVQIAESLSSTIIDFNPEFKYIDDLKKEIDELKKQVNQNTKDIESLKSSGDLVIDASTLEEFENNLKSDLLTKEQKFNVFIKMINKHSDVLINKPITSSSYDYEINFTKQIDFNSLDFINIQLVELEKLTSLNQKILLIKLIRGELITVLGIYDRFFNFKIAENLISESKLVATINLYKKCLSKYQEFCYPDIPIGDLYFLELFVPFKMIQNCYIEASILGIDTIFFNSNEFKSFQNDLIESFIKNLTDYHHLDNRITQALVTYKEHNEIDYWFWNLLLFIYFNELNKRSSIYNNVMTVNEYVKLLKNMVGAEFNLRSYNELSIPLLIDKTGVRFNENLFKEEVTIGSQIWMTKNLDVDQFQNGDKLSQAKTFEEWKKFLEIGESAWCYYDFDETNSKECGKIYNWFAVIDRRLLAPKGWHIPSSSEWEFFLNQIGGCFSKESDSINACAGKIKFKTAWGSFTYAPVTNETGFSALPCGELHHDYGKYSFKEAHNEKVSFWWSSTWIEPTSNGYQKHNMNENYQIIEKNYNKMVNSISSGIGISSASTISLENGLFIEAAGINEGFFIRCVKN